MTKAQKEKMLEFFKQQNEMMRRNEKTEKTPSKESKLIQILPRLGTHGPIMAEILNTVLDMNLPVHMINTGVVGGGLRFPKWTVVVVTAAFDGHNYKLGYPVIISNEMMGNFMQYDGIMGNSIVRAMPGQVRLATNKEIESLTDVQLNSIPVLFL